MVAPLTAWPTNDDPGREGFSLEPGTRLRHDQSDWTLQGCFGCEDLMVWERFAVLDGLHAGHCVEFQFTNPPSSGTLSVIPPELEPA